MGAAKHHKTVERALTASLEQTYKFMLSGLFGLAFSRANGFKMKQNSMQCSVAIKHIHCMHTSIFFLFEKCNRLITGGFVCYYS